MLVKVGVGRSVLTEIGVNAVDSVGRGHSFVTNNHDENSVGHGHSFVTNVVGSLEGRLLEESFIQPKLSELDFLVSYLGH
jgi:hypothetical protein